MIDKERVRRWADSLKSPDLDFHDFVCEAVELLPVLLADWEGMFSLLRESERACTNARGFARVPVSLRLEHLDALREEAIFRAVTRHTGATDRGEIIRELLDEWMLTGGGADAGSRLVAFLGAKR